MPIEQFSPELEKIIATSEPIQTLADGFGGAQGPAEGPVWWKESRYLLFSDIHNNRRMKYTPGQGVSLFQEPTNRANGLTRDLQGRLLACEHDSRRVTRQELDGSLTVIANSFQGRQLNRPNDVVVKSDGCIYFTDPWTNPSPPEQLTIIHIDFLSAWPHASPRPVTSSHAGHATRSARQASRPSDDAGDRRDERSTTPLARA